VKVIQTDAIDERRAPSASSEIGDFDLKASGDQKGCARITLKGFLLVA
jgi:hypothetical protein